jgi:hypothetical protein
VRHGPEPIAQLGPRRWAVGRQLADGESLGTYAQLGSEGDAPA